ncbi:MAG: prepilin-type N-terminal cleavage/methylation domain-containing protein [Polyangiaceae bacterium]|nr:prepilin-type N-terminal cleavage/methylation domain-containing protein [Polyangiaceae bacterium]
MSGRSVRRRRGFTLIELMIAVAVLAMITTLVYSAFAGMKKSRDGVLRITDRYREGRIAMSIIVRDLQSAFLSSNIPVSNTTPSRVTAFISKQGTPLDRVDFATLAYRRLDTDVHESDQAEVSYFGSKDPESDAVDLVRRVDPLIDTDPEHGGRVEVLATDVALFDVQYLDPLTGLWVEEWDTRQATGVGFRLPHQVRVLLVLHDGNRKEAAGEREDIRFITKVPLMVSAPLKFTAEF